MEYLMTGKEGLSENCVSATFTREEEMLLQYYREMAEEDQEELLMIAQIKAAKGKKGGPAKYLRSGRDSCSFDTA